MSDFNPDEFLKEEESDFDPDEFLNPGSTDKSKPFSAALEGFGQGATFGYLNELQAGLETGIETARRLGTDIGKKIKGEELTKWDESDNYESRKDYYDNRRKDLAKENPGAYMGGNIGGALATGIASSPLTAVKGATALGRIGQQAAIGGAQGFLQDTDSNDLDLMERAKNAGIGALTGGVIQGGTEGVKALSSGARSFGKNFLSNAKVENADDIIASSKRLGAEATPGMTSANDRIIRLEESLSQSPSWAGKSVKDKYDALYKASQKGIEDLTEGATSQSSFQLGEDIKRGMALKVGEDLAPASMLFDQVAESTRGIDVSKKGMAQLQNNIKNLDEVRLLGLKGKAQEYVDIMGNIRTVDDLKKVGTLLGEDIKSAMGSEKKVLLAIKDKLRAAEESNIMRAAEGIQKASKLKSPLQEGKDLVGELKDARKQYAEKMGSYSDLADKSNLGRFSGRGGFEDIIDGLQSEKAGEKLFNLSNEAGLESFQKTFPEVYELAKSGKLASIKDKVMVGDKFSIAKFATELKKMNPESKARMFGEGLEKAQDVATISNNFPKNYNPSGTSSASDWSKEFFTKQVTDIPRYAAYKFLANDKAVGLANKMINSSAKYAEMATSQPNVFAQFVNNMSARMGEDNENKSVPPPQAKAGEPFKNKEEILQKSEGSKYAQVLQNAAQKGDQSLAAAHFVLNSRDQSYRELMSGKGKEFNE